MAWFKSKMLLIYFIIVVEGIISISVEILGIRQITPFAGSNVVNTSIIIGSFLLALSFGYYKGGSVKDGYFEILIKNLLFTQLFFSIGLSYLFIEQLYELTGSHKYILLLLFSFGIIAPIVYFLGQTVPILSNLFEEEESNGEVSGKILFLSTFGSFIGSVGSALILISLLGVSKTIITISALMFILILAIGIYTKNEKPAALSALVLALAWLLNYSFFIKENVYSNIKVTDFNNTKYLWVNRSASSSYCAETNGSTFWYVKQTENLIRQGKGQDILVAGAGAFTIGCHDKNNTYTYVDVDKDLKEVAEKYVLKQPINGKFVTDDIRRVIKESGEKYDIVISDVYQNISSIPPLLTTKEYYEELSSVLKPNGYAILNIIARSDFSDDFSSHINQTINSQFNCTIIPQKANSHKRVNILYVCYPRRDAEIYTDDKIKLTDF